MTRDHRYRVYVTLYLNGKVHEKLSRVLSARTMHEARIIADGLAHRLVWDRTHDTHADGWSASVKVGLV